MVRADLAQWGPLRRPEVHFRLRVVVAATPIWTLPDFASFQVFT
jgi:hypothetical protein